MMIKPIFLLLAAVSVFPAAAADAPQTVKQPELHLNTAEPPPYAGTEGGAGPVPAPPQKVVAVNGEMLAARPELLARAMNSAVMAQNTAGIKALLPVYRQWEGHDAGLALFGQAMLAQAEGRPDEAVGLYRRLIADKPDALMVRLKLAQALFENRQNEAAADQFDRLLGAKLPEEAQRMVEEYREALRRRNRWQVSAGIHLSHESNINQAPAERRLGRQLDSEQCALVRSEAPEDDCFRGWTFDEPVDGTAVNYQAAAEKKWPLARGFYIQAGFDGYGRIYPSHSRYNDMTLRVSAGAGRADARNDAGIAPFHERRFYGNDAYSHTNGIRAYWDRWLTPRLQSLSALELSRLNNVRRENADLDGRLASASLVFYRNAEQYWLAGGDFYRERNREDESDNFQRYGLRTAWGQEWRSGFSSRLQLSYARRRYETPSFFSNGEPRRDKEAGAAVSVWHRAVHFSGITPRLTFSRHRTSSNDAFYGYGKNRLFVELGKTF